MKNTIWQQVEPGQLVQFRYKGVKGDIARRLVFCLDPSYQYRKKSTGRVVEFFIGLELDNSTKTTINPMDVKRMFVQLNDIVYNSKNKNLTNEQQITIVYQGLKKFLDRTPIFRTYFLRECRKKRVFLIEEGKDLGSSPLSKVVDLIISDKEEIFEGALSDEN
ncbi:hypothetical protein EB151_07040 [archaeon]|nr:hypothetical protein [archaeon]